MLHTLQRGSPSQLNHQLRQLITYLPTSRVMSAQRNASQASQDPIFADVGHWPAASLVPELKAPLRRLAEQDLHVASVVDARDRVLGTQSFAATRQGYLQMI